MPLRACNLKCVNFFELFGLPAVYRSRPGYASSSSLRASRQPVTRWPSTRRAGWSERLPVAWRRARRSRVLLSSMLVMASHSSLTTASSVGKWPRALVTLRSW